MYKNELKENIKEKLIEKYSSWDISIIGSKRLLCTLRYMKIDKEFVSKLLKDLLYNQIQKPFNISEYYYWLINDLDKFPLCQVCGEEVSFRGFEKGYSKFCSSSCIMKSNDVIHARKIKNIEIYGMEWSFQVDEVKEKIKKTNLERYGGHPVKNEKIKEKIKQTCLDRYGVSHPSKLEEIKEKIKQTCLDRYGVMNVFQIEEVKEKIKFINIERYGVTHNFKSIEIINKSRKTRRTNFINKLLHSDRLKERCTPNFTLCEYNGGVYKYSWTCIKCGNIFEDHLLNGRIPRCLNCYPKLSGSSYLEKDVVNFIKSLEIEVIENDRKILEGKELDIYIPSYNLAIEFDGLYWHSELNGIDKNYHLNKTLICKEKGIQLIHIFEDEWIDKQEIVKSIIKAKLGKLENKIFARKCIFKPVPSNEAKLFLFDNHLQGPINGTHMGLYYNEELVSLITYGKSRFNKNYDYEILRFCNKIHTSVVGGLSKLIKHANLNSVITYADLRYGTGDSYLKCDFQLNLKSPPSYYYLKDNQRISRLNFQKHLLEDKLDVFDLNLTEWENMQLNGYDRIWDCGCFSFSKESI